jgi:hypothetical protein
MKTFKYLALLLAAAMFLVACGTSENGEADDTGTLIVNVVDADTGAAVTADIAVTQGGTPVDTQTGVSTFTWEVPAGAYTVAVSNAEGYLDLPGQTVNVPAGDSNTYTAEMVAEDAGLANVDALELSFVDVDGNGYDSTAEINPVKDAILVAAQTEEQVGVQVLVTDAEGEPVANAPVTVSVTGDFSDALAIYPGQAVNVAPSAAQTFQGLTTDDEGMAYFVIEATNADLSWQEILNFEEGLGEGIVEPTKLIVSAVGGDNIAKRVEFKSFFTNMSHLWYGEGEPGQGSLVLDEDSLDFTEQRLGKDFGEIINIWEQTGDSDRNVHYFGTWALTKQPSFGPFAVGTGLLREIENGSPIPGPVGLESAFGGPFFGLFPGRMEYTITDVTTDGDGDPLVEWYDNGISCDALSADGLTCTDDDGSGVGLSPVSGVSLDDLPVEATVQATYYFEVVYGDEVYEFALKDYTFTKRWIGSFLEVDKYVDQHVLTWAGPDVTLDASDDPDVPSSLYTSTVNVTVSNGGDATVYQITVRDGVPAELGVVTDTISNGGTYDPVNHTVTWNNVEALQALDPGEEFTLTFDVYARHKPGFCWDGGSTANYVVPEQNPLDGDACVAPYDDPYLATNGKFPNSVTAAGFFEDDVTAEQLVFSYAPVGDESDIWVVRPLIELDKELVSAETMTEGAAARFAITARQRDRVSTTVDPASTEYAFLNALYPWEFTGALDTGDGHVAAGQEDPATNSEVRNNPYLHDVDVNDAFEVGLDFTQGLDFDSTVITPSDPRVVGKDIDFNTIASLPRGTAEIATITLTGNLISDDGDGNAQNGAVATNDADPELFAWNNCAYLSAPQLNQPAPGTVEFDESIYAGFLAEPATYPTRGSSNLWLPDHFQIDGTVVTATELVEATDGTTRVAGEVGQLEACDAVAVIPAPPTPLMTLTNNGEVLPEPVDGVFDPTTLTDGFETGETFYYIITAANAGGEVAEDVTITVDLNDVEVRFNGTASLYLGSPETWTTPAEQSVTLTNQSTFTFAPVDVQADGDPNDTIRIVLTATANQVGTVDLETSLDYTNPPGTQTLPLQVSEDTTVQ